MAATSIALGPDRLGRLLVTAYDRVRYFGPVDGWRGEASRTLECPDSRIEPGWINAHTHLYSGLAPLGMPPPEPEPENFVQILERVWWRLDRSLDEASLRASARLYIAESLLAGTTTLIDHHESPSFIDGSLEVLADAAEELGVRAALCFGATERNGGGDEAMRGLEECARFIGSNRRARVRGLVSLHASFTVSDDTVRRAAALCSRLGAPMHVHMAEDGADVEDAVERGYQGPLERLMILGALPRGSLLAHGVHLSAAQVRVADRRGLWLIQNPRSNRGNEVGYPLALGASGRVALGTDGYPAKLDEEAAVLRREASSHGDDPTAVEARVEGGWRLAAELFGAPFEPLGRGALADVVARDRDGSAGHVLVGGRLVVEDGGLLTADLAEIRSRAAAEAESLWRRMAELS